MYAHVNDADLYYEEAGTGEKYILCMTQIPDPDQKGWPYDLAPDGYHVYIIQMRGYGKSTHISDHFENDWYDTWADDVDAFARQFGIERYVYTGLSDGAGIGWHLCLRHPGSLIGFVSLSGGPHSRKIGSINPFRKNHISQTAQPDMVLKWATYQKQCMLSYAKRYPEGSALNQEFREKAEKLYADQQHRSIEEFLINPSIPFPHVHTDEELLSILSDIRIPMLLINGKKDAILPPSKVLDVSAVIPGVKVVSYQDGTNRVQYDHRQDVHDEILLFLKKYCP